MKKRMTFLLLICAVAFAGKNGIIEITQANSDLISQSELPVILDVNAKWCNPCRKMNPIIGELSGEYNGKVQFAKADYDTNPELVSRFGVEYLPTILFFKPGQSAPAMKSVGYVDKATLKGKINAFLKKS